MKNIFFISDMHFGHEAMTKFLNYDGTRVRPFNSAQEVDELIVKNWNDMVSEQDTVYVLGDVAYSCKKEYVGSILVRLKGNLKLIAGNHDLWSTQWYLKYFKYVRGCGHLDNFFLSHVPIHSDSKGRFKLNICGHIHGQQVMKTVWYPSGNGVEPDPFYYNVSVDLNYRYAPVPYEDIQSYYKKCLEEGLLQPISKKGERI